MNRYAAISSTTYKCLQYKKRKIYRYDDLFFHPIVCHICKWLNGGKTNLCVCGMISYCCDEHMLMDREQTCDNIGHEEICDIILQLTNEGLMRSFPGGTFQEWDNYKQHYLNHVKKNLTRELRPHEKQMILYARSCYICHKEMDLKPCDVCFSVYYCEAHRTNTDEHHCMELKEWLYFEIQAISIDPVPEWQTFHDFPNKSNVYDMHSFYEAYLLAAKDASWTIVDTVYSDYLSCPLTMYYGLRDTNLLPIPQDKQNTFVIHIVEANNADKRNLLSWEILLHVFKKSMKLIVVLIGSELGPELEDKCGILQTCWEKCFPLGHELYFNCYRMLYQQYVNSLLFVKPDVIIGFQADRHFNRPKWAQFISSLRFPGCPIILTTQSQAGAQKCLSELQNIHDTRPILNVANRFKSFRPYRDHASGRIFFNNEHLLIFERLGFTLSTENSVLT